MDDFDTAQTDTEVCDEFHIVGVGASAGGLEALEAFFRAIPADSGMAFVVIQHLSPDFKSHMEELLARQTSIPVHRVENGQRVRPNHIYLIPAKMEMVINEGKLLLTERSSDRTMVHPVDQFFRSLATDVGRYAVGVVLSGTGNDGARGVRDIHEAGGLVIAQDDVSAKFYGMPGSARETGMVHVVLPPIAIAEALVRYTQEGISREKLAEEDLAFGNMEVEAKILHLLHRRTTLDFSQYKSSTVGRRINRRMQLLGLRELEDYLSRLTNDEHEQDELYKDLLIGVTKFFRDRDAFESLRTQAIEKLIGARNNGEPLRVWVAACATGEEAYSLAILIDEEIQKLASDLDFKIFATDEHKGSLQIAGKGVYSEEALSEVTPSRRDRYFTRTRDGYQVQRYLRNKIVFAPQNLINDAPFTQMDLVSCRNMLIYLQPTAQRKVLSLFHFALNGNGVLFLGPSESPGELSDEFQPINKRWRIFKKRRDVRLPLGSRVPIGRRLETMPYSPTTIAPAKSNRVTADLIKTYDRLLAKKMGCSILVSESGDMLHIFGGAEKYLRQRGGRPSNHLLEMIDESLKNSISTAWHHALAKRETVQYAATQCRSQQQEEMLRISVQPLASTSNEPCEVLVEFEQLPILIESSKSQSDDRAEHARMHLLESELRFSQENLQATIEEMETSNEELQATNEELVASNEELQSTNEELHSVNEELYTVNAEHQRRVEELALANDDMDNLLATTRVGVIFLDDGLYIRRFTPEIARVFDLDEHDMGRSMEKIAHMLNHPELLDELRQVMQSQSEREVTVRDSNDTPYLVRMLPYQSSDETRGVVLTLVDIATLAAAEKEIRLQQLAIESAVNGIIITDPRVEGNPITYANRGFLTLTGYELDEVIGRNCKFLQGPETDTETIRRIRDGLDRGQPVRVAILNYRKDGKSFWNDLQIAPVYGSDGKVCNFVGVQHDITNQILAQEALKEANEASQRANEAKNAFLATMSHELRTPMTAVLGFADMLRSESDHPDFLEKVDIIKRNGSYLLSLLNDILDLSRIEAGKLKFEKQPLDILRVVREVERLMQPRTEQDNVTLRFRYAARLPSQIMGDEVRIRQILVNLIRNAIKFTPEGEVVVQTDLVNDDEHSRLEISISDTGIGITPNQMKRLFVPFSQASKQTTRQFGGTGLGLSISKRLAEGMGGTIHAESEIGRGSRFTLSLPLSDAEAGSTIDVTNLRSGKTKDADNSAANYPRIESRVLLADDRRDIWRIGKFFLERCGAEVTIAENGQQAVEAVRDAEKNGRPFSLVLMDMQMPIMDGREAVATLRQEGFTLPIIAITADAMEGERESCIEMGCDEYFPKPINGPKLTEMVASLIDRHRSDFASEAASNGSPANDRESIGRRE
ncbi:chemotaxis protein CheB [Aporhodopirellula aestuarii]|uniref:ATP-binding protein n=1 Tax=Aporhodopirellula aestuarii TaxID=2950107 RepID=A0ABT0UAR6_9BACT|nr:chemotaxis protein CheB [Aporhodopirellula aestuarii]MCM2373478.1 ATP-binding protein [Aporhodopirellula aestuarii]